MIQQIQKAIRQTGDLLADTEAGPESEQAATSGTKDAESAGSTEVSSGSRGFDEPSAHPPVDVGHVFEILRNQRRRDVLWYLLEGSETTTLSDLAEHIAARECEKPVGQLTAQERKRVYIGLYQSHLPKMADSDAIDYNQARGTVERGPQFNRFTEYLPDEEHPDGGDYSDRGLLQHVGALLN